MCKEFHLVAKVANKYLAKCAPVNAESSMRVESLAVYGGVAIESQLSSLLGIAELPSQGPSSLLLAVAATAG